MSEPTQPSESKLLFFAVVQAQDAESAQMALLKLGVPVTRLPSVGGFLGRRNATLLIEINPKNNKQQSILYMKAAASE